MNLGLWARAGTSNTFTRFLSELAQAKLYQNWRKANPGEAARFDSFVTAPATASPPPMLTAFGRALVAVVEMRNGR